MLDRLVSHKFVKRFRGEDDRRVVFVSITLKGKKIVQEIYEQKRKGLMDLFGRLSRQECFTYLEILEKLVQNLSKAQDKVHPASG
jgi:DNA-binding MarR family transcriptional regulator